MDKDFLVIGLTGGSGTGKTIISKTFLKHNIAVIDADKASREVMSPGSECLLELSAFFGPDIIGQDGTLKRRLLANIAFSDPAKTEMLNKITHKYIKLNIDKKIKEYKTKGCRAVVLDAPTLLEGKNRRRCDKIISVIAEKDVRIDRIIKRDNLTLNEAKTRISAQRDDEFFIKNSDYVIINNNSIDDAISQTQDIIYKIFAPATGGDDYKEKGA